MYLVSISAIVLIVFIMSNWKLEVTIIEFFKELFYWGTFTMLSTPPINNSQLTEIINAGVVWSLPYEWWFYFSLPIISLLILRKGTSKFYMIMSLLFVVGFYKYKGLSSYHVLSFVGGAIAPFIIKYGQTKIKFNSIIFSIILLVCLAFILFLPITDKYTRKVLTIVVFNLIALGNSVFGILKSATLKFLGEISYSTYLIHGIIIFTVMYFYFGLETAANLSATEFCLTIFSITPIVVFISFLSFKNIEKPCMNFSKRINVDKIKHRITGGLIPQRVPKK
ncbi:acyltransferase family protein [Flavobacterium sp. N1994]|uniref:acyltransferase family protein n=1 Tax=Flavobacterium sp. N1994 TaxID=2986827 RepID=UPI0022215E27|nr:acyltransferase [Flavobacterium sp. N1994]